jgi:hypothetical protein
MISSAPAGDEGSMRRLPLCTLPLFTTALLALGAGCDLDPESVGDESTGTSTGSTSDDDSGTNDTTAGDLVTTGDDGGADGGVEVSSEHEGTTFRRLARTPDGVALTLGFREAYSGSTLYYWDPWSETQTSTWDFRYFEAIEADAEGNFVAGGWQRPDADPLGMEAYLFLLLLADDGSFAEHEVVLAGGSSFVAEVAIGGDMLWTLTAEGTDPDDPRTGVLRRHGAEGAVELTHPLLAPSTTLAVDVEGFAYSIAEGDSPQLHRVTPEGAVAWSLPVEVTGSQDLHARPGEPGVVIVSEVEGGRHVQELDGDGVTLHEFLVPAMASELAPASDVGDAILLAHPLSPDSYIVEARSIDGTQLWSATRSVPDASAVQVGDVLEIPGGAVVVGQAERDASEFSFIRFIDAP